VAGNYLGRAVCAARAQASDVVSVTWPGLLQQLRLRDGSSATLRRFAPVALIQCRYIVRAARSLAGLRYRNLPVQSAAGVGPLGLTVN